MSIAGSIGLPVLIDLLRGDRRQPGDGPWRRLPQWEAGAAFWLLFSAAGLLFVFETPGVLSHRLAPTRSIQFEEHRAALRDSVGPGATAMINRGSLSVFMSATLRSAGLQSVALSTGEGHAAISWPTYAVLLAWMTIGGSIAGTAGGMRTSTLLWLMICLFIRGSGKSASWLDVRRRLRRGLALTVLIWVGAETLACLALAWCTEGRAPDVVFDAAAAFNNTGLSSGLMVHLTGTGMLVMMLTMIVGRWLPILVWIRIVHPLIARANQDAKEMK
jgi:Trk-type K+ transport system membrane component